MKRIGFALYGALIGATCALYGSAMFALLAPLLLLGPDLLGADFTTVAFGILMATLFSVMYAILPGAIGGAYLARWLEQAERTTGEIAKRGLIVGALAGLLTTIVIVVFLLKPYSFEMAYVAYGALACLIAAGMSWLCARMLAKDLKKRRDAKPAEAEVKI